MEIKAGTAEGKLSVGTEITREINKNGLVIKTGSSENKPAQEKPAVIEGIDGKLPNKNIDLLIKHEDNGGNILINNSKRNQVIWIYGKQRTIHPGGALDLPLKKPDWLKDDANFKDGEFYVSLGNNQALKITVDQGRANVKNFEIKSPDNKGVTTNPEKAKNKKDNERIEWSNNATGSLLPIGDICDVKLKDNGSEAVLGILAKDKTIEVWGNETHTWKPDATTIKIYQYFKIDGQVFQFQGIRANSKPEIVKVNR